MNGFIPTPDFRALNLKCCNPECVECKVAVEKVLNEIKMHPWYLKKETVKELEGILK